MSCIFFNSKIVFGKLYTGMSNACIFMKKDPSPRRVLSLKYKSMAEKRWSHSLY